MTFFLTYSIWTVLHDLLSLSNHPLSGLKAFGCSGGVVHLRVVASLAWVSSISSYLVVVYVTAQMGGNPLGEF